MALKCREEVVGKRFLSVSGCTKLKIDKIREWGWRSGVIRAASHRDKTNKDLQVLVEYDGVDWKRREWINVYNASFKLFFVEQGLLWLQREVPFSYDTLQENSDNATTTSAVSWPVITFTSLVSSIVLPSHLFPAECQVDRELLFIDYDKLEAKSLQEIPSNKEYLEVKIAVKRWHEQQDGQKILLTTPSVLVGYRVEVYRSQGTTQWYTAVIIGYNESTRDLTVTDDTVLEEHNVDPTLVQMRLIGDGVVESIMRGENVGITPRRSRSTAVLQAQQHHHHHHNNRQQQHLPITGRILGGHRGIASTGANVGQLAPVANKRSTSIRVRKRASLSEPVLSRSTGPYRDSTDKGSKCSLSTGFKSVRKRKQTQKETSNGRAHHNHRRGINNDVPFFKRNKKEDLENKQIRNKTSTCNRVVVTCKKKKKVLEEANNSKLKDVQIRVEDCLRNGRNLEYFLNKKDKSRDDVVHQVVECEKRVVIVPSDENLVNEDEGERESDAKSPLVSVKKEKEEREEDGNSNSNSNNQNNKKSAVVSEKSDAVEVSKVDVVADKKSVVSTDVRTAGGGGGGGCGVAVEEEDDDDCVIVSTCEVVEPAAAAAVFGVTSTPKTALGRRAPLLSAGIERPSHSHHGDDDGPLSSSSPFTRMDLSDTAHASYLRFPDDRSDSGISSFRSSSGDERSGSRSSALSSSDEPTNVVLPSSISSSSSSSSLSSLTLSTTTNTSNNNNNNNSSNLLITSIPSYHHQQQQQQHHLLSAAHHHIQQHQSSSNPNPLEPVRVWRDPSLLLESEPHVRHIHSVQHQSLLMSHPSASAASGPPPPPPTSAAAAAVAAVAAAAAASHPAAASSIYASSVVPPPPTLMSPHHPLQSAPHPHSPHHPHAHLAPPPPGLYPHHVTEMLWKQRYQLPVGTHLLAPQTASGTHASTGEGAGVLDSREQQQRYPVQQDRLLLRERQSQQEAAAREQMEKREQQQKERERQQQAERDKLEREQKEKEKQRVDQAVHKHFEESLRRANQKRDQGSWNLILPPPQRSGPDEERKRSEQEHQQREQQRHMAMLPDMRDRVYYPTSQRPPSLPSKTDYPPPAHSRIGGVKSTPDKLSSVHHPSLSRAEVNMFGYPAYQPQNAFFSPDQPKNKLVSQSLSSSSSTTGGHVVSSKIDQVGRGDVLPPSSVSNAAMMSELKNSVIVKHDAKAQHFDSKSSPNPKMVTHYLSQTAAVQQGHKNTGMYDYRSPTQSPHHMQHLGDGKSVQQRPMGQTPSPHLLQQRQSPHPSPADASPHHHHHHQQRYRSSSESAIIYPSKPSPASTGNYNYHLPPSSNYSVGSSSSSSTSNKSKVSSPAPHHIYGKPSGAPSVVREIIPSPSSNNPIPLTSSSSSSSKPAIGCCVSPSPFQQVSQYHPPHHQQNAPQAASSCLPPPPAHSSRPNVADSRCYDRMLYPGPAAGGSFPSVKTNSSTTQLLHGTSPPTAASAPSPISRQMQYGLPGVTTQVQLLQAVQTQPLDLGMSSANKHESAMSPKRKASTPVNIPTGSGGAVCLELKKRRIESQPNTSPYPVYVGSTQQVPQLARVSEPSPLIASAATTITTVVNTAAYKPPPTTSPAVVDHIVLPDISVTTVNVVPVTTDNTLINLQQPTPATTPSMTMASSPPAPAIVSLNPLEPANGTVTNTPVKPPVTPTSVDSDKSNSPGPIKTTASAPCTGNNNPVVRHLKKAWLQRHTGEDSEDTTGMTGGGSCVTLPLNINNSSNNSNSSSNQTKESSGGTSSLLHNIGSMAVNSISKSTKATFVGKTAAKKVSKDAIATINGHPSDSASKGGDDSSSSDPERGRKSPPKRKPPKVKRKKGGGASTAKKLAEEQKKRKLTNTSSSSVVAMSESGSESDKESGSDKDSDSGASTTRKSSTAATAASTPTSSSTKDKEPKKRGRRPKSSKNDKGEEPRPKKTKEASSGTAVPDNNSSGSGTGGGNGSNVPPRDPFRKPPVGQLKRTGESFLQDGPCFEVAPKLAKCRECRWTPNQRSKNMPNIFCRFYAFRRLRYTKNGQLAIAGFSDPHKDASEEDLKLWLPSVDSPPIDLDMEKSRFLLKQVGDHFCDLLLQERDAQAEHMSEDKKIAWKRVVQGVREMCDVCETTLFNFHWACGKCGFVVCLDCYKSRKNGTVKVWGETSQKDRDDFSWLLCTNRQPHEQEKLMLTQIIAGQSLQKLGRMVHEMRELWNIEQYCSCPLSKEVQQKSNGARKEIIKSVLMSEINGLKKEIKEEPGIVNGSTGTNNAKEEKTSPLSWLADVALSNEVKKEHLHHDHDDSTTDSEDGGNFSTLRELLIRPSHKQNGSSRATSPVSNSTTNKSSKKSILRIDTLDDVISSVIEDSVPKNNDIGLELKPELKHFVRRYNKQAKGRKPLPIRIMTLTESKVLYPDVPHSWLCDGRLLRLTDPNNIGNYKIFQDQWKRGQPVIVSDVTRSLNKDLWNPEAFARDFGDEKNDLVNCMNGNLVPNQPMRKFWEGFEHYSKRLKDERGTPMLLKLKDWPPGEDFAEMLPTRFSDLMKVLPLSEYTHRTGKLNLASRLPECFVRPDLGPKMYNAYGSALHPTKGTTNLHLDISDAVNVMVYVGIPKDGDGEEYIKEAFRAIDEAGCDILTRRRVRDKGELPGALWHIYNARDADKIRDLLNKVVVEKGGRLEPHHDPIHDQSCYLDGPLRERLYKEYGVEGYAIVQCLGDAVFIPAGAPHQVRNLHNCIKVAEDFVSPENVAHCFHLTQEFRELSDNHSNHEDKLQIKNIIYHAVKDSLSTLSVVVNRHMRNPSETEQQNGTATVKDEEGSTRGGSSSTTTTATTTNGNSTTATSTTTLTTSESNS